MLPYPQSNPRPNARDLLMALGLIGFLSVLGWQLLTGYRQSRQTPALHAAAEALDQKNVARATALFEEALKAHPNDPTTYRAVSQICGQFGQSKLQVEYARRGVQACQNAPKADRAQLYANLAMALEEDHAPAAQKEALASVQRALELAPDSPTMLNAAGYLMAENGIDLERARGYIERALRLIGQQTETEQAVTVAQVEDSYGWVLYKQGDFAEAVDILTQALSDLTEGERSAEVMKALYFHLGAASRKAGRLDSARRALQIALQYDPDYLEAKKELELLPPASTPPAEPLPTVPTPRDGVKG